ncbi:MAG: glycosyltransferase [Myxococcota bacterium]
MKLAYLVSQYPATSHTFIRREVEALREQGVAVETFSIRPPSEAERTSASDRGEYERTWYVLPPRPAAVLRAHLRQARKRPGRYVQTLRNALAHRVPGARAVLWAGFHFAEAVALADELEQRGVDHLHNHFANSGANVGFLASTLLGIDWSLTLHGISEFDYPAGQLLAEKIVAARFVACVTHFGRAQALRMVDPAEWDKLFVSRCGLDLADFRTKAAGPGVVPKKTHPQRVLSVGRLSPEKGHVGLVEAFAHAVSMGVDAELRFVGDGPERERIEARVTALGLQERVSFAGRVPATQVAQEFLHADVFAMSSFMEGLPVVIMEALAMEVPVVAPAVAGIPELIEHEVSGLLFPPSDWTKLGVCLATLCRDRERAATMAREGRQRVEAEFAIQEAIKPLLQRFVMTGIAPETD